MKSSALDCGSVTMQQPAHGQLYHMTEAMLSCHRSLLADI